MILEACVETLAKAQAAEAGGAHQIELCANLELDGLTPDLALVEATLRSLRIPVKVMIRPRAGTFVFTEEEVKKMVEEIEDRKAIGAKHFVIGLATAENELDIRNMRHICARFPEADFTLHKVIDTIRHPLEAILQLNSIPNLRSILTSGGAPTALEGAELILAMHRNLLADKQVIAAGKITTKNLAEVIAKIPVGAYHGRNIIEWSVSPD